MKINPKDIIEGYNLKSFDEEDGHWYKTVVVKVTSDRIVMKDVDPNSPWQGLEFDTSWENIEDVQLFRKLQ